MQGLIILGVLGVSRQAPGKKSPGACRNNDGLSAGWGASAELGLILGWGLARPRSTNLK